MELMERGIRNWNGRRKKKAWGKGSGIGNGGRGEGGVRKEARNRTAEGKCGVQRDACENTVLCECDIIHDFLQQLPAQAYSEDYLSMPRLENSGTVASPLATD